MLIIKTNMGLHVFEGVKHYNILIINNINSFKAKKPETP